MACLIVVACLDVILRPDAPPALPARTGPPGDAAPGIPRVLSSFEIARIANEQARAHLGAIDGGRALRIVDSAGRAVVLFLATVRDTEWPRRPSSYASGVLVNGGRHALVAGHSLDVVAEYLDPRISVSMFDGRLRRGKVPAVRGGAEGAPDGDWGLVELEGELPDGCPSLKMRSAVAGSTVVMLGYSEGLGVDERGRVYPAKDLFDAPLRPLAFVGKLIDAGSGKVEVVAGMLPAIGASGGAILDLEGYLVGVMASVNREWRMGEFHGTDWSLTCPTKPDGTPVPLPVPLEDLRVRLEVTGTPVAVFREFIEKRWKR